MKALHIQTKWCFSYMSVLIIRYIIQTFLPHLERWPFLVITFIGPTACILFCPWETHSLKTEKMAAMRSTWMRCISSGYCCSSGPSACRTSRMSSSANTVIPSICTAAIDFLLADVSWGHSKRSKLLHKLWIYRYKHRYIYRYIPAAPALAHAKAHKSIQTKITSTHQCTRQSVILF